MGAIKKLCPQWRGTTLIKKNIFSPWTWCQPVLIPFLQNRRDRKSNNDDEDEEDESDDYESASFETDSETDDESKSEQIKTAPEVRLCIFMSHWFHFVPLGSARAS